MDDVQAGVGVEVGEAWQVSMEVEQWKRETHEKSRQEGMKVKEGMSGRKKQKGVMTWR